MVILYATARSLPALLVLGVCEALPTVGIFRLAVLIARGDSVALSDAFYAWRTYGREALLAGLVLLFLSAVFGVNVVLGVTSGSLLGGLFAAFAGWGLVVLWTGAIVFWPLLVDPRRDGMSLRERLRLTALMVIAFPIRLGLLLAAVVVVLVVSTVFFVALISVSVAFVALAAARYVLPAADRFEGRATELVVE